MLKNVRLKRLLKNYVFPLFSVLNKHISKVDNIILLYSANGGINNSLVPLRNLLLERNADKTYKIFCGIESLKYADNETRVKYLSQIQSFFIFLKAKHVFYTTGQIPIIPTKDQCVIQLGHGVTDLKAWGKWTKINNGFEAYFTYRAVSSDLYVPILASEVGCDQSMILPIGDALADMLYHLPRQRFFFKEYNKLLLWYPTFRKSDYLGYNDSTQEGLVPLFEESDYKLINDYLKKLNIKLIVKTHPMQNSTGSSLRHYSHFDVYTHQEFVDEGMDTYKLLAQADGMIGDYSSISMHSIILDIPLAFVIPDIEEYRRIRGFAFEHPEDFMCGHIVKEKNDFWAFLEDFSKGIDKYKSDRQRVRNMLFKYQDGRTCERAIILSGIRV